MFASGEAANPFAIPADEDLFRLQVRAGNAPSVPWVTRVVEQPPDQYCSHLPVCWLVDERGCPCRQLVGAPD